jgi:streptogramin lyase
MVSAAVTVCTVDDPGAVELSGLVATQDGYVSVIDSQFDSDTIRIVYLDSACAVRRTQGYPTAARDPEDIAVAPDGTLWVSDTGDNITAQSRRSTVALWRLPAGGGDPVIHRLSYPDGPHDAEALLFDQDGQPIIVTKEISGLAGLYRPTGPLQPQSTTGVQLEKVGTFRATVTGASNPLGSLGEMVVTGAATSPDRRRVALRTYAAAYEWDVPDGDMVKAITTGTPRYTPLPDEPQGEAIAYTVDGQSFLTLSDESGPTELRRYQPSTVGAPAPSGSETATAVPFVAAAEAGPDWRLWAGVAALAIGLLTLVVFAVVAIRGRMFRGGPS